MGKAENAAGFQFVACTHSYPRVQLSVKEQTELHTPKCKASVIQLGKLHDPERNGACCKAPLPWTALRLQNSSALLSLHRFGTPSLHFFSGVSVLALLTAPSCFEGRFRAQLTLERNLAPSKQGGDVDSRFPKKLTDLGAQILLRGAAFHSCL